MLVLAACAEPNAVCDPACADGEACVERACRQLCNLGRDCAPGLICQRGVCTGADCGNGVREGSEECDDGPNNADSGTCTKACRDAVCGDGFVQVGIEGCDLGSANADTGLCTTGCQVADCGDGLVQGDSEACDDGDANDDSGTCTTECQLAFCGDAYILKGFEGCDNGAANDDNASCTASCQPAVCGDARLWIGLEACDLGVENNDSGACTVTCTVARCGDGFVWEGHEACDDGADNNDSGLCTSQCEPAYCGDGLVWVGFESCDYGTDNNDSRFCTEQCEQAFCGDGLLHVGVEACDEGVDNNDNGACTATCKQAICGDERVWEGVEDCDDGNQDDNDSCTAACTPSYGDTCATAQLIALDETGRGQVAGTGAGLADDYNGSCSGSAVDVVYQLHLDSPAIMDFNLTAEGNASVHLRETCESAEIACGTTQPFFVHTLLGPADYHVFLELPAASAYVLDVTRKPINDTCAEPFPLRFPSGSSGSVQIKANTTVALNDYETAACNSATGPDLVYRVDLEGSAMRSLRVDFSREASGQQGTGAAVYLTNDPCVTGSLRGCMMGSQMGPNVLYWGSLTGGSYYLVVDGITSSAKWPFELTATVGAVPSVALNDHCELAQDLTADLADGVAQVQGWLDYGTAVSLSCCGTGDYNAVFKVSLSEDVEIAAFPDGNNTSLYLGVFESTCGGVAQERYCTRARDNMAWRPDPAPAAGEYYIVVKDCNAASSYFALDVRLQ